MFSNAWDLYLENEEYLSSGCTTLDHILTKDNLSTNIPNYNILPLVNEDNDEVISNIIEQVKIIQSNDHYSSGKSGFPMGQVTEIVGEASTGKSQVCLQTLLMSLGPSCAGGGDGRACIISTRDFPSFQRLETMVFSNMLSDEEYQALCYIYNYASYINDNTKETVPVKQEYDTSLDQHQLQHQLQHQEVDLTRKVPYHCICSPEYISLVNSDHSLALLLDDLYRSSLPVSPHSDYDGYTVSHLHYTSFVQGLRHPCMRFWLYMYGEAMLGDLNESTVNYNIYKEQWFYDQFKNSHLGKTMKEKLSGCTEKTTTYAPTTDQDLFLKSKYFCILKVSDIIQLRRALVILVAYQQYAAGKEIGQYNNSTNNSNIANTNTNSNVENSDKETSSYICSPEYLYLDNVYERPLKLTVVDDLCSLVQYYDYKLFSHTYKTTNQNNQDTNNTGNNNIDTGTNKLLTDLYGNRVNSDVMEINKKYTQENERIRKNNNDEQKTTKKTKFSTPIKTAPFPSSCQLNENENSNCISNPSINLKTNVDTVVDQKNRNSLYTRKSVKKPSNLDNNTSINSNLNLNLNKTSIDPNNDLKNNPKNDNDNSGDYEDFGIPSLYSNSDSKPYSDYLSMYQTISVLNCVAKGLPWEATISDIHIGLGPDITQYNPETYNRPKLPQCAVLVIWNTSNKFEDHSFSTLERNQKEKPGSCTLGCFDVCNSNCIQSYANITHASSHINITLQYPQTWLSNGEWLVRASSLAWMNHINALSLVLTRDYRRFGVSSGVGSGGGGGDDRMAIVVKGGSNQMQLFQIRSEGLIGSWD